MTTSGDTYRSAALDALRWSVGLRLPARTGAWWLRTAAPDAMPNDSLYAGTAGVLHVLARARLAGVHDFDDAAREAAAHLTTVATAKVGQAGLYAGAAGVASALADWDEATGSPATTDAAFDAIGRAWRPGSGWGPQQDLMSGDAGILLALVHRQPGNPVIHDAARELAGLGVPADGGLDWTVYRGQPLLTPNFSHGTAGVGYALARLVEVLGAEELLPAAVAAGKRMVAIGDRGDGTWLAPHSIPQVEWAAPHSFGWCHGPTGSLRLFAVLDRLQPGEGWDDWLAASRRTVRESGLPERREPGFWDNVSQCCGTAGVGDMALDAFADTQDEAWLTWACALGDDLLDHATKDVEGTRWSNVEHTAEPPELDPEGGWAQGTAGVAAFLLRLADSCRDGFAAAHLRLPDAI